jgi:hypothetical protein
MAPFPGLEAMRLYEALALGDVVAAGVLRSRASCATASSSDDGGVRVPIR